MDNKRDIYTREDIEKLIVCFYEKVKTDDTIGFIFTEVVKMDWESHIPVIVDFWETILLDNPVYKRNAMEVHYTLNQRIQLTGDHFNTWIRLFSETVDELYEGKIALLAKTRAKAIASLMEYKMANETR